MPKNKGCEESKSVSGITGQLPKWFLEKSCDLRKIYGNEVALVRLLNASRQDFYSALALYQVPVKYVTTLVISIMTTVGVVFSFVNSTKLFQTQNLRIVEGTSIFLLVVACLIGFASIKLITRYYNVYVSALLFATQLHYGAGMRGFEWFEKLIDLLEEKGPNITRKKFISCRTWSWFDSHLWYMLFIAVLSSVCLAAAILIFFFEPLSSQTASGCI